MLAPRPEVPGSIPTVSGFFLPPFSKRCDNRGSKCYINGGSEIQLKYFLCTAPPLLLVVVAPAELQFFAVPCKISIHFEVRADGSSDRMNGSYTLVIVLHSL